MLLGALFAGDYDYWELRHSVTFDGIDRLIYVNSDVTSIDVEVDLYSDWKEWSLIGTFNSQFLSAMRAVGSDPLPGGDKLGATFFLTNGWRIVLDHGVEIVGNLYTEEGDSPFIVLPGVELSTSIVSNLIDKIAPDTGSFPTADENADAVRVELTPELDTININLDAKVSSRATQTSVDAIGTQVGDIDTTVNSIDGKVDIVDANVTTIDGKVDAIDLVVGNIDTTTNIIDGKVDLIQLDVTNILDVVNDIIKYHANRTFINKNNFTLTVYEADNSTPFKVYDLKNDSGVASIVSIFERLPQ